MAAAFARGWTAVYTIGLASETRARRREEIASDLWDQQHDGAAAGAGSVAARVVCGMPADLVWRVGEARPRGRLELMSFAVDATWDARMRTLARAVAVAAVVLYVPIAIGLPPLLLVTVPAGALLIRRIRQRKKVGIVTDTVIAHQRRTRAVVVAVAVAVFAVGLLIESLPSQEFHDRFWWLLVAPMMFSIMVGVVAVPMLVWSYLPRRPTASGH